MKSSRSTGKYTDHNNTSARLETTAASFTNDQSLIFHQSVNLMTDETMKDSFMKYLEPTSSSKAKKKTQAVVIPKKTQKSPIIEPRHRFMPPNFSSQISPLKKVSYFSTLSKNHNFHKLFIGRSCAFSTTNTKQSCLKYQS